VANTKITTNVIADGAITSAKLDTNITISGNITGTLATAAQPNITSLGTLTGLTTSGAITAPTGTAIGQATFSSNIIQSNNTGNAGARIRLAVSSEGNPVYSFEDDTNTGMFTSGADTLNFATGGTERLRINSTGIDVTGTATMDGLTVSGNPVIFNLSPQLFFQTGNGNNNFQIAAQESVNNAFEISSGGTGTNAPSDTYVKRLVVQNNGDISFYEDTGSTAKFFWDASAESLGIGTSSPVAKLDIHMSDSNGDYGRGRDGNLNLENTNTLVTEGGWLSISGYMGNSASGGQYQMGYISGGKQTTAADGDYGGYLTLWTTSGGANGEANSGGYERMRIDSSGNVGIGDTSPDQKLHVNSGASNVVAKFESTDSIAVIQLKDNNGEAEIGAIGNDIGFYPAGAEKVRIDQSGHLLLGTSTTPSSSDVKQVISSSTGAFTQYSYNGGAGSVIGAPAASEMAFYTTTGNIGSETYTERWRFNSSGHFTPAQQHTYDIGGTNAEVRNIYAQGISFASNAHAGGMTSELLDDYEEGTYTATISCASGSITLNTSFNALRYTKVGRQVHVQGTLAVSSVSSPSGATYLNLPFASGSDTKRSGNADNVISGYFNGSAITNGIYTMYGNIPESSSTNRLFVMPGHQNSYATYNLGDNFSASGTDYYVNFTYTI